MCSNVDLAGLRRPGRRAAAVGGAASLPDGPSALRLFLEVRIPPMGVATYYLRRASKEDRLEKKNLAEYVVTELIEVSFLFFCCFLLFFFSSIYSLGLLFFSLFYFDFFFFFYFWLLFSENCQVERSSGRVTSSGGMGGGIQHRAAAHKELLHKKSLHR